MAMAGWTLGKTHIAADALVKRAGRPLPRGPVGEICRSNRWRWTPRSPHLAGSASGWDLSAKAGVTFNGENHFTDYDTGTELHLEGSIEKKLFPGLVGGVQAYHFHQLSGDHGAGAVLGPSRAGHRRGRATSPTTSRRRKIPATLRLHGFTEFDAKNRLDGNAVLVDFVMPLWVKPGTVAP
jgi:hypothetical protein